MNYVHTVQYRRQLGISATESMSGSDLSAPLPSVSTVPDLSASCVESSVSTPDPTALSSVSASVRIVSTLDKTAAVISVMLNMKFEHNYDGHSKNKLQNGLISSLDTFQVKGLRRRFNSSAHTKRITVHSSF